MNAGTRPSDEERKVLAEFHVASEPGNERIAMVRVEQLATELGLPRARVERLKTAVAEATMNAIEHGNHNRPDLNVDVRVLMSGSRLSIEITDQGDADEIPQATDPDIDAKLAGLQTPRGWGLFLIRNMVDELHTSSDGGHHTIELVLQMNGAGDGHDNV